jgi:hypothetical protein
MFGIIDYTQALPAIHRSAKIGRFFIMESAQILAQLSEEEEIPNDWIVLPLQRQKVLIGILGWIFGALVGGLLFAFMAPIMIPHNYQNGIISAIVSTLVLGIVLYVCLGSIWAMIVDIRRVREPDKHIIIITPEDFVKQEGNKIIHVPLEHVKYVTARGIQPQVELADDEANLSRSNVGEGIASLFMGRRAAASMRQGSSPRRRMRTPTTLAFIDSRTDREVIVVTDKAYGEPHAIAESLREYALARANAIPAGEERG